MLAHQSLCPYDPPTWKAGFPAPLYQYSIRFLFLQVYPDNSCKLSIIHPHLQIFLKKLKKQFQKNFYRFVEYSK